MEKSVKVAGYGIVYRKGHWRKNGDGLKVWWESPSLWIGFKYRGKHHAESAEAQDWDAAIQRLKNRVNELHAGRKSVNEDKIKFDQIAKLLLLDYKINKKRSLASAELSVKNLRRFFGGYKAVEIRGTDIMEYIAKRQADGLTNASINRELSALKRMFALARQGQELIYQPHIPMLKEDNVRQGFVNHVQFLDLVQRLPIELRDFVRFLYFTGLRVGAARSLENRHVDLSSQVIYLPPELAKNNRGQTIPITGELFKIVEQAWKNRLLECPYLFHRDGKRIGDFRKSWESGCVAAGLGRFETIGEGKEAKKVYVGLLVHDLRRSAVRNLVRAGVSEKVAMQISGHKTRSVFDRYNIVSEDDLRNASERLQNYLEQQKETKVVPLRK